MEVKKYEAFNIQDAIKLVRKELGRDAVILSTREKSSNPVTGKKTIEVVAARGVESSTIRTESTSPVLSKLNKETTNLAKSIAKSMNSPSTQPNSTPTTGSVVSKNQKNELEEIRNELSKFRKDLSSIPNINISEQMQELKILVQDLMQNQHKAEASNLHPYLTDIAIKLRAAGVIEPIITELFNVIRGLKIPKNDDGTEFSGENLKDFYLNSTVKLMMKQIKLVDPLISQTGGQKIICLVGPTGVGKTTTAAKMAAIAKLKQKKSIAFVSMDNYRIAAADQLRIYSKILDCPFGQASDVDELMKFIKSHRNYDYIFIDTSGRSSRDQDQMNELKALRNADAPIHFELVLACTMKQRDHDANLKSFKFLELESIIYTKLDESWGYGEIFNSTVKSKIPLSYFSVGQRVPEDLELAVKDKIIERLFGI